VLEGFRGNMHGGEDRLVNLLCVYFAVTVAWCFAMSESTIVQVTCVIAFICVILVRGLQQLGVSYKSRGISLVVIAYGFLWISAVQTGGIHSSITGGLMFIPAFSIVLGRRAALNCLGVSLLMIGSLLALTLFRPDWLGSLADASHVGLSLGFHVTALLTIFQSIWLFDLMQQERCEQLEVQTRESEHAHAALETAQGYKDNVVASVSHELRTPMNAILGFNELLQAEINHLPAALQISDHISASAKQLLRVINGILDYSQLVAGKLTLQYQSVDVQEMVMRLEQVFAPLAALKQLTLTVEIQAKTPLSICADVERLTLVLDHLLNNALKFTHHGHVTLRVIALDSHIRFEIEDSGIGIPDEQQALVFSRFNQGSQEINRRYGGTGLGLAICEEIVQLHGGKMGLTSQEGVGSTFWLEIVPSDGFAENCSASSKMLPSSAASPLPVDKISNPDKCKRLELALRRLIRGSGTRSLNLGDEDRILGFLIFMVGVIVINPIYALPYPDTPITVMALAISAVFSIVVYLFFKDVLSLRFAANFVIAYCTVHLFVTALYTGGIHSATMPWLALIPLAQINLIGRLAAFAWLGVCVVVMAVLAWLTAHGLLLISPAIPVKSWIWPAMNYIHLSFVIPYLPLFYKYLHDKSMQRMGEQNAQLLGAQRALLLEKKRMDEFISSVSDEFRTPMNAIIGFTGLLEEYVRGSAAALEMHSHMTQSAKHLLTVIDDILDYSQIKKGQLAIRRETFDLRWVSESANLMFKTRVQTRHTDYRLRMNSQPFWVEGDSHRLMQLLVNLLGNAVKFTDKGLIELSVAPSRGGVLFEVRDTGIGIAPDRIGQLFQHFEQVHALLPGRYEGNGLGLSISKRLVELQGGHITVSSALGVGSLFSMWLPLTAVPAPQLEEPSSPQIEGYTDTLKILVVDDHPLNRMLVKQILERNWPQAELVDAADGAQAIEKMKMQSFDLVLMDMLMPVMDGIEAAQYIRQRMDAPHNQTPILGLTANVNPVDKQRCMDAGMNVVLYKPLNKEVLIHHIEAILKQKLGNDMCTSACTNSA
jgi:signal transduction histidine kinase/ActR/RegA family two-component response regulator